MDVFPANLLIDGIPAAGVVLMSDGEILATNERMESLTGLPSSHAGPNAMLGQYIQTLPIVLIPTTKPVLRDWTSLFEAAKSRLIQSHKRKQVSPVSLLPSDNDLGTEAEADVETATFWETEDRKELAMIDVYIYVQGNVNSGWSNTTQKRIRSRMCIRAISWSSKLRFIVTFRRPLTTRKQVHQPIPVITESERCNLPIAHTILPLSTTLHEPNEPNEIAAIVSKLIPSCMAVLDTDGQVLHQSQSWYEFSGLSEEESLGAEWAQSIHPDDIGAMMVDWADVIHNGRSHWTYEARFRGKDGSYTYFLIRAQPARDEHGNIRRWYASMIDVNELVLARLESDYKREAIMMLLSQADISLWGIDQRRNTYVREGTLPWDPSKSQNKTEPLPNEHPKSGEKLAESETHSNVKEILQDVFEGRPFQSSLEHKEGNRWYRTRFVADTTHGIVSTEGKRSVSAALGLTIDVTDVRARAQLQIDNECLAVSSRAASEATELKSRFLANMSHEIRTPIAGILGLSEIMRDKHLAPEQEQLSYEISTSASFLLSLVNDILDFSKIEAGHMDIEAVPFNPSAVITTLSHIMTFEATKKQLTLSFDNHLPHDLVVNGDPGRLQQVLTNMLSNAIKFTTTGSVILTSEILPSRPSLLESHGSTMDVDTITEMYNNTSLPRKQDQIVVQFTIKDTGCGIDDETMSKLFRPFSQADSSTARKYGGTGLGLTISRQLVELMGGEIQLTSTTSSGTTAIFSIPYEVSDQTVISLSRSNIAKRSPVLSSPSQDFSRMSSESSNGYSPTVSEAVRSVTPAVHAKQQSTQGPGEEQIRRDTHILVVEDNAINQKIALITLRRLGFSATAVWNGQEAIDYLANTTTTSQDSNNLLPNIILMDCMMPIMDGYETTQMLRSGEIASSTDQEIARQISKIPIIAMTASTTKGDRERCEEAGMNDYLSKPMVRDELERMLLKWTAAAA